MKLKCKINNGVYDINLTQGATFKDEYNETLDSGTIVLSRVSKIKKLKPYDDVFIYSDEDEINFTGYCPEEDCVYKIGENKRKFKFYKHLLVDAFTEERINVYGGDDDSKLIYKYKISLFSETKGLETIQLPNISITQPITMFNENGERIRKTIWEYLQQYIYLYSPKIRVKKNRTTWQYIPKYVLSHELQEIFGNVYAPEKSWNSPNLRDIIADLMIVKDCIPYVEDGVIRALDISKRRGEFNYDKSSINYITASIDSSNYADNLRRTYNNALSQEYSCHMIEYMGFRNSSAALMTLENMRIETRFPIYKINKIYMCYYKKGVVLQSNFKRAEAIDDKPQDIIPVSDMNELGYEANVIYFCREDGKKYYFQKNGDNYELKEYTIDDVVFLCKQDITPLVKLNSERNILSSDWADLIEQNKKGVSFTIKDLAKYKIATVGYDIGSNYISGWGEKYNYPIDNLAWFKRTNTCLQNIFYFVDSKTPYGIYNSSYYVQNLNKNIEDNFRYTVTVDNSDALGHIETIYGNQVITSLVDFIGNILVDDDIDANALKLKSFFFMVDYQGFYNGSIVHSKDYTDGEITINDNSSSSLTLLEQDGLFQKEKINRYGNKDFILPARYKDFSEVQELGSVYSYDEDEDVIIYHREYQIWENEVVCTYRGSKDYVLKNYFTTVFARHRTYSLMSYGESVRRAENKKLMLFLSKNKLFYENDNNQNIIFDNFEKNNLAMLLAAFYGDETPKYKEDFIKNDLINYAYIKYDDKKYLSDLNLFVDGLSLCANLAMFDNVSSGVFISQPQPEYNFTVEKDYVGSVQEWYMTVDEVRTGRIENIGFYVCHINQNDYFKEEVQYAKAFNVETAYDRILKMPLVLDEIEEKNTLSFDKKIYKDNKELIDMTFQIEPISDSPNVMFSQWLMKLSSLIYNKQKISYNWDVSFLEEQGESGFKIEIKYFGLAFTPTPLNPMTALQIPAFYFTLKTTDYQKIKNEYVGHLCDGEISITSSKDFNKDNWDVKTWEYYSFISIKIKSLTNADDEYMHFNSDFSYVISKHNIWNGREEPVEVKNIINVDFIVKKIYENDEYLYFFSFDPVIVSSVREAYGFSTPYNIKYFSPEIKFNASKCIAFNYRNDGLILVSLDVVQGVYSNLPQVDNFASKELLNFYNDNIFTKTIYYYQNMFLFLDANELEKTIIYDEYTYDEIILKKQMVGSDVLKEDYRKMVISIIDSQTLRNYFNNSDSVRLVIDWNGSTKVYYNILLKNNEILELYLDESDYPPILPNLPKKFILKKQDGIYTGYKEIIKYVIQSLPHYNAACYLDNYSRNEDVSLEFTDETDEVYEFIPSRVEDFIETNFSGEPYIKIKVKPEWKNIYKSLQYWFCDKQNEKTAMEDGSFKFVFGVNFEDADFDNEEIKIYISSLSNKSKTVYDVYRNPIGEITNYAEPDCDFTYGEEQNYTKYENN